MGHSFKCAMCDGEFVSDRPQEVATAELNRDFGNVPLEQCDEVCDVCYQEICPENNPEYYQDYLASLN